MLFKVQTQHLLLSIIKTSPQSNLRKACHSTPLHYIGWAIATMLRPLLGPLRIPKCVCCVGVCVMCNWVPSLS